MLYEETEKKEIERIYAAFADSGLKSWAICC